MAGNPTQSTPGSAGRARAQPPAMNYPQLHSARMPADGRLPRELTQAIQQSFETAYSVRDQTTANADAINHMVNYGTMRDRINTAPTALPDGALWYVTDYPNAVYQVRVDQKTNQLAWFYGSGVVWKTPAGGTPGFQLGLNDAGYMVVSGSSTSIYFSIWDGTKTITIGA